MPMQDIGMGPDFVGRRADAQTGDERMHLSMLMRRAGVRVTHSRLLVLQVLHRQPEAGLTASDIYQRLLEIGSPLSLSTIYSVLQPFKLRRLVAMYRLANGVQVFSCLGVGVSPGRGEPAPAIVRSAAPAGGDPAQP